MVDVGDAFCYVSIMVNFTIFKKTVFDCCSNDLEQIQVKPKVPRCKSSFCEDRIYNNLMYNDIYIVHNTYTVVDGRLYWNSVGPGLGGIWSA